MKTIQLNQTDSTNLYLEKHLKELPKICSVRADIQTAGMGRLARHWDSAKGGLWFSVLFKSPELIPFQLQKICSLATLNALNDELESAKRSKVKSGKFLLKWPNDIYFNSRKISGCLQKNIFTPTSSNCIIGIGVNVNNPLIEELIKKAINLKTILSKEIDVEQLYHHILENIERRLSDFSQEELEADYRNNQLIKEGTHVKVLDIVNNNHYTGRVVGYPGETLEIFTEEGLQLAFKAADVTLKSWED